ncbi:hypothetical protein EVAR_49769_1 [Eumeta japonica]|uniref:Uncharacterized protein n=1 Tax=Eumeta variegata TaxID=151549 RepID=A0A4C1Y4C4_EUMVA|nr:hypothetical protein EVAR_49769_1 [Eumeta japonica]
MPEWKGRVPLTHSHCERITASNVEFESGSAVNSLIDMREFESAKGVQAFTLLLRLPSASDARSIPICLQAGIAASIRGPHSAL